MHAEYSVYFVASVRHKGVDRKCREVSAQYELPFTDSGESEIGLVGERHRKQFILFISTRNLQACHVEVPRTKIQYTESQKNKIGQQNTCATHLYGFDVTSFIKMKVGQRSQSHL